MPTKPNTIRPVETDAQLARMSRAKLAPLVGRGKAPLDVSADGTDVRLPASAARLLLDALEEIGKGHGVTITPVRNELTTQQAADFLSVSRPYLIEELLEKGTIPYRKVGNRRRIRYEDLLRHREAEELEIAHREKVMRELMEETERLGLYR